MSSHVSISVSQFPGSGTIDSWNRFWFTPRSGAWLGTIRCLAGVLALYWYLTYLPVLQSWFGSQGLLSTAVEPNWRLATAFEPENNVWLHRNSWSLFSISSSQVILWAIYGIGLAAIVAVIAGWKVQYTTLVAAVFVISLMQRAPMFVGPGEALLAMLFVYLSLAPYAAGRSIINVARNFQSDANESRNVPENRSILTNVAVRMLQIHVTLFLLSMIVSQLSYSSWRDATAAWYLAARVDSRWWALDWLRDWPILVNVLTIGSICFELALIGVWRQQPRKKLMYAAAIVWFFFAIASGSVVFPIAITIAGLATLDRGNALSAA